MASALRKLPNHCILRLKNVSTQQPKLSTFPNMSTGRKVVLATTGILTAGAAGLVYSLDSFVKAATELNLHPPKYGWYHNGFLHSLDHASVRRGYEVYKQVCAACHGLKFVAYRHLINQVLTEAEAKAEAAEMTVTDGPNDMGEMFQRPGKVSDYFQSPYANEEAARAANNGAFPPDLSLIVLGRHGGEDYIFSLLTGYTDAPAGVVLGEGQHYNPYFKGGAIGMAKALYNEVIEYSDGTPATASQTAKDICNFLKWTGENEFDTRQRYLIKVTFIFAGLFVFGYYYKRHKWVSLKTRKLFYVPKK